jgi:hypothetical protein
VCLRYLWKVDCSYGAKAYLSCLKVREGGREGGLIVGNCRGV